MLKAQVSLSEEQIRQLAPLFDECTAMTKRTKESGTEQRGAILGQIFGPSDDTELAGMGRFYLLSTQQYQVVASAIKKALALKEATSEETE